MALSDYESTPFNFTEQDKKDYYSGKLHELAQQQMYGSLNGATTESAKMPERTFGSTLKDVGVSLGKGIVGAGEAAVGLADLVTPGNLGKAVEDVGINLSGAQEYLAKQYSPAQQQAFQRVEEAKGFLPTIGAMVQNPSTLGHAIVESVPSLVAGGMIGKGLGIAAKGLGATAKAIPMLAGAAGEGAITAGQVQESVRKQSGGETTLGQQAKAIGAGIGTGAFGLIGAGLGNQLAKKLGTEIVDIDTLMAGGKLGSSKDVAKKIIAGGISEGAFEELPQSMQEQVWTNAALGQPLDQDVGTAGAAGLLAGAVMGGGTNVLSGPKIAATPADVPKVDPINGQQESVQEATRKIQQYESAFEEARAKSDYTKMEEINKNIAAQESFIEQETNRMQKGLSLPNQIITEQQQLTDLNKRFAEAKAEDKKPIRQELINLNKTIEKSKQNFVNSINAAPESMFNLFLDTPDLLKQLPENLQQLVLVEHKKYLDSIPVEDPYWERQIKSIENQQKQKASRDLVNLALRRDQLVEQIKSSPNDQVKENIVSEVIKLNELLDANKDNFSSFDVDRKKNQNVIKEQSSADEKALQEQDIAEANALQRQAIEQRSLNEAKRRQRVIDTTYLPAEDEVDRINAYRVKEAQQNNKPIPVSLRNSDLITRNGEPYQRRDYLEGFISDLPNKEDYEIIEVPLKSSYEADKNRLQTKLSEARNQEERLQILNSLYELESNIDKVKTDGQLGYVGRLTDKALDPRRNTPIGQQPTGQPPIGQQTNEQQANGQPIIDQPTNGQQANSQTQTNEQIPPNEQAPLPGRSEIEQQVVQPTNSEASPDLAKQSLLDDIKESERKLVDLDDQIAREGDDETLKNLRIEKIYESLKLGKLQKKNDPNFEIRPVNVVGSGISLANIKSVYPGQEVTQAADGSINVKLKNGRNITIQSMSDAGQGYIQYAIATGQMSKNGKILGVTTNTNILLDENFADNSTLWHENKHVLDNLGMINQTDNSTLTKEFNKLRKANKLNFALSTHQDPIVAMEENLANIFAQVMTSREAYRDTALGKMIQRIMDFMNKLFSFGNQTISALTREVETGKIYNRQAIELDAPSTMPQFKEAGNTNSAEFKSWFGKSAAKTRDGMPVPFYHGSPTEFTVFEDRPGLNTKKTAAGFGHFFTMDRNYAAGYSKGSGNVMEVYLKMEKPYKMSLDEADTFTALEDSIRKKNELKAKGYDSIILQIPGAKPIITIFDSGNIKSTANRGTWDSNNPDIRFQEAGNTNSAEFKSWFKGSKVVDSSDDPLVVYHGTKADFSSFAPGPKRDIGYHFGSLGQAQTRLDDIAQLEAIKAGRGFDIQSADAERSAIMPVYLSLKNPLKLPDAGVWDASSIAETLKIKPDQTDPRLTREQLDQIEAFGKSANANKSIMLLDFLQSLGYDSIIYENESEGSGSSYMAFEPGQIKSIFNKGTWDSNNPNVRFQTIEDLTKPKQTISQAQFDQVFKQQNDLLATVKQTLRKTGSEIKLIADKFTGAISTRLNNINPMLRDKMRELDYRTTKKIVRQLEVALPILRNTKKNMSPEDKSAWDWARKNSDAGKIDQLATKYGFKEQYSLLREELNKLRNDAEEVGYTIGFIDEYWPRVLNDREGFLKETRELTKDPIFSQALEAQARKMGIKVEQLDDNLRADIISNMILGRNLGISGTGNMQSRKFDQIDPKYDKFYMHSDEALMQYIYSMNKKIEARRFFGKVPANIQAIKVQNRNAKASLTRMQELDRLSEKDNHSEAIAIMQDNIDSYEQKLEAYKNQYDFKENIGSYVDELMLAKLVDPSKEQELRDILDARFHERGTTGVVNAYKNLSYIDTMGSPLSAVTQIGDLAWAYYVGGLTPSGIGRTTKNLVKAVFNQSNIKKEDLGFERIAQEFADADSLSRAVNKVFWAVGLEKLDSIGKETLINTSLDNYKNKARQDPNKLHSEIKRIFGSKTDSVINELLTDEVDTNPSDNVKYLVYSRVLDFHPASLSEMPEKYLNAGNGRIFYMLKSYTLKQMDVFRNEVWRNMKEAYKEKDPKKLILGMQNMVSMGALLTLANAGADEIKDLLTGKEMRFEDHVIENLMTLGGASRYMKMQTRQEGIGTSLAQKILPPFKFIDSISKDLFSNTTAGFRSVDSIPIGGKLYYWHYGRGADQRDSIAEQDFAKLKKTSKSFKEKLDQVSDKRLFLQSNIDEFRRSKQVDSLQGTINGMTATIGKLKKLEQTPNVRKRIGQLEQRKELLTKNFITRIEGRRN